MARPFSNLTSKISPARLAAVEARTKQALTEMDKAASVVRVPRQPSTQVPKASEPTDRGSTLALYQDQMDGTRFLSPVKESKAGTLCRVYWDNRKVKDGIPKTNELLFGGMATLPSSLFTEERGTYRSFVGFLRVK